MTILAPLMERHYNPQVVVDKVIFWESFKMLFDDCKNGMK